MFEPTDGAPNRSAPDGEAPRQDVADSERGIHFDALDARLSAVERALTDGDAGISVGQSDAPALDRRLSDLAESLAALDDRVAELEAATQALRGYVGGVRAVNRDVERRADAALAAVERLESDAADRWDDDSSDRPDDDAKSLPDAAEPAGEFEADAARSARETADPSFEADDSETGRDGVAERLREST